MSLSLSTSLKGLEQSDIRVMSLECDRVGGINLSQGVCDMETPPQVIAGAKKAMESGDNFYTSCTGIPPLREALAKKLLSYNKIKADPQENIVVSAGATGALFSACLALLRPGDEVILFEPFYGYHLHTLLAIGAKPVFVRTHPPDWHFDFSLLEKSITKKTRAILICTPSNPSGKVFTLPELKAICELCEKHDLIVFTDEIYEYFVYGDAKHTSPASLPQLADRTVTISGYSKTFSTTGWRIGYCVCKEEWAIPISHVNDLLYVCAPTPLQFGIAAGINSLQDSFYSSIRASHQKKRDEICAVLDEIGLRPHIPQGAYYILADASSLEGNDSKQKSMRLLGKTGVASVPGRAFYHDGAGDNLIRFCFAKEQVDLQRAYFALRNLKK